MSNEEQRKSIKTMPADSVKNSSPCISFLKIFRVRISGPRIKTWWWCSNLYPIESSMVSVYPVHHNCKLNGIRIPCEFLNSHESVPVSIQINNTHVYEQVYKSVHPHIPPSNIVATSTCYPLFIVGGPN